MTARTLQACRILVVEDENLLADELAQESAEAGAQVLGPAPTIELALSVLEGEPTPDGAILDVNLSGVAVFPLADTLIKRGVPLVFTTGYDPESLPIGLLTCQSATNRSTCRGSRRQSAAPSTLKRDYQESYAPGLISSAYRFSAATRLRSSWVSCAA
jgi:CheY-like chemotaxis protein